MRHGFTLIELLVVIAIIGILSSIVMTSLNAARAKGRDAKRQSDVKQIQLALELYYDAQSVYPATLGVGAASPLVTGGYIATLPTDPVTNIFQRAVVQAGPVQQIDQTHPGPARVGLYRGGNGRRRRIFCLPGHTRDRWRL